MVKDLLQSPNTDNPGYPAGQVLRVLAGPPIRNTADIHLNSHAELNPKAKFCERERTAALGVCLGREHQMKWVEKVHFRLSCPFIEMEAFLQKPHCYLVSTPSHTEPHAGSWRVSHRALLEIQVL